MSGEASGPSLILAHAAVGGPANRHATPTSVVKRVEAIAEPARPAAPPAARAFDRPPAAGVERLRIAYSRVRLSSLPDDLRSAELGRLDRGDEVELVDSHEGYLLVRTPAGVTGWVHRHALTSGTRSTET